MINDNELKLNSEKINKRERRIKALKLGLLISALFLMIIYVILRVVYEQGAFIISLDQNFAKKSGIIIYENDETKESRRILEAEKKEFVSDTCLDWILIEDSEIDKHSGGPHNGNNHIAYTFYIQNLGNDTVNYWYTILIDDVIKNVDEAIRVMIYLNDERMIYAKPSSNGQPETDTIAFYSDDCVLMNQRQGIKEGETDKMTIVIWVDGPDPDCIDPLIGGQIKMHMEITEEKLDQNITQ